MSSQVSEREAAICETAWDEQLIGRPDVDVLERATAQGRVVVTHDVAFGRSAIRAGTSFVGIIYLRPGHISAGFVLEMVACARPRWTSNRRSSQWLNDSRPRSAFACEPHLPGRLRDEDACASSIVSAVT